MKKMIATIGALTLLITLAACGGGPVGDREIASGKVGNLTVTLVNADGVLRYGDNELTATFKDASGQPVDVGSASLNFHMQAQGSMPDMNDAATFTKTPTPGVYHAKVKLQMKGDWQAQVAYEGPAGTGKGSFPVKAQ